MAKEPIAKSAGKKKKGADGNKPRSKVSASAARNNLPAIEKSPVSPESAEKTPETDHFYVVGIGASAGGLDAFEKFFRNMPSDSGMAFVLVPHLDPKHKSMLGELLKRFTQMQISEALNGMKVEPNALYIIPPNKEMTIVEGKLKLFKPTEARGARHSIDSFFRSMAKDLGERAIGLVLSGTGTEGSLGLRAIKGEGGLAIVQDPKTAQYPGMPESAIATGIADYIFSPDKVAKYLVDYVRLIQGPPPEKPEDKPVDSLRAIYGLIRSQTGIDFSLYKQNTIMRRIEKRKAIHQIEDIQDYIVYLKSNPHEVDALVKEFLIRVTNFFRDSEAFEILKSEVLPQIISGKTDDEPLRVWVPGCSTGEEAYSLAIVIREAMNHTKKTVPVQIFATDIDSNAIEQARIGLYTDNISVDVSPERLSHFFVRQENGYKARAELREMVVFAVHNLIKDPPFMKLDLLSCRNVLIYMGTELQKKAIPLLCYALKPDGLLFLGPSENIGDFGDLFETVDKKWKIFRARGTKAVPVGVVDFEKIYKEETDLATGKPLQITTKPELSVGALAEQVLLENYSPPCVVVNDKGEILYFHGRTGQYLEPAPGKASFSLSEMAKEGLKLELISAFRKVLKRKENLSINSLEVKSNGTVHTIDLELRYITTPKYLEGLILVVFRPVLPAKVEPAAKTRTREQEKLSRYITELEFDLKSTKENLQTTIEELETSNEELKSTNEELQSSNEELRSTNEELETSREELQSVNEELVTVNSELQEKIEDVTSLNNDMKNLLSSTQIATIFLDKALKVKGFTPAIRDVINFIDSDIGRPMKDIAINLDIPDLESRVEKVIRTNEMDESTVRHRNGRWYFVRIAPYRTTEDLIAGAVLTFFDITEITEQKELLQKVQDALTYAEGIVETVREPLIVLDSDLRVITANKSFYRIFKVAKGETERHFIYDLGNRQWDIPALRKLLEEILPKDDSFEDYVVEHEFETIGKRKMLLNARRINQAGGRTKLILLAIEDLTKKELG